MVTFCNVYIIILVGAVRWCLALLANQKLIDNMNPITTITNRLRRVILGRDMIPHGQDGIHQVGHRQYVGGLWEELGQLQFQFLLDQGLQPEDVLLDIACGSLRAGRLLIPFLDPGNYLGIDKEASLIEAGLAAELPIDTERTKRPSFVISDSFEFDYFEKRPDVAIAQSLFTHLPAAMIDDCFQKLSAFMNEGGVFYATFFVADRRHRNPTDPHDHAIFRYTKEDIIEFGYRHGLRCVWIADWGHPRGQQMVMYR